MEYDIAIIGGGPAGYTAAERASENGLKTILFEKNAIGGVCLNEGCIPTKTLLYSAKILDSIKSHRTNIFAVFGYPFVYTLYLRLNKARCSCNKHSCTCFVKLAAVLV